MILNQINYKGIRVVLILMISLGVEASAQTNQKWSDWKEIYKDNDITVELKIYTPNPNSCQDPTNQFKFKYRVTGKYKATPSYLNWSISYYDCNNLRYYQHNSLPLWKETYEDISYGVTIKNIDQQFTGDYIDQTHYDIDESSRRRLGSGLLPLPRSETPTHIEGLDELFLGTPAKLRVEGGSLGEGAKWVWYIGECGKRKVGEGKTIEIKLPRTTKVFVRAEGENNITDCVEKAIVINQRSTVPQSIIGNANICNGDNTKLSVQGGSLGLDAQWVWYERECGGTQIGVGKTISVQPRRNTEYFVRAEGKLNTTACMQIGITVNSPVSPPTTIRVEGSKAICRGETVQLNAITSGDETSINWYSGSCGGRFVGSGNSVQVQPQSTTTYYARGEGVCNKTICASQMISVSERSSLPAKIIIDEEEKGKVLKITSGHLAPGAQWKWYRDECGKGLKVGTGSSILIKESRKARVYYVRAKGACSSNQCRKITVPALKNNPRSFQNFNLLHYGFNLGMEYNSIEDISTYSTYDIESLYGLGLRGEVQFHPILKDFFSVGFLSSFSVGTTAYLFDGGQVSGTNYTDNYFYTHANLQIDLALGFRSVKLLARFNKEYQDNNLYRTVNGASIIDFDNTLNREHLGLGLRVKSYRASSYFDIVYLLYRNNTNSFLTFENAFRRMNDRFTGFQFSLHKSNAFTFRTNLFFPVTQQILWSSDSVVDNTTVHLSFLLSLDRFY